MHSTYSGLAIAALVVHLAHAAPQWQSHGPPGAPQSSQFSHPAPSPYSHPAPSQYSSSALSASKSSSSASAAPTASNSASTHSNHTSLEPADPKLPYYISLGARPYYIINNMTDSPLKTKLQSCENGPFQVTDFTIGHRGGSTLQIPEESVEDAVAGARFGAGILECDTSLTADKGLVCSHSLCNLHTTTDILLRPDLAAKCAVPFTPANATHAANVVCCTTDITEAEFKGLCAKMDGFNASATAPEYYQGPPPTWRTTLYDTCATPQTLESYLDLINSFPGYRNFTPELKSGADDPVTAEYAVFPAGYTQEDYAHDFVETFIRKGLDPKRVWMQSFNPPDIFYWIKNYPEWYVRLGTILHETYMLTVL